MITITGDSIYDILNQIRKTDTSVIHIAFRRNGMNYGLGKEVGCVVNAVGVSDDAVPIEFKSSDKALEYIKGLLYLNDEQALKEQKQREL